tara:strand:+ start:396 stop:1808 length:1413 start_codon:yes stop_codon:yes gene_type:complete
MAPLSETAKNYKDALSELKMNSKPIITSLTMLATEIAKTDDGAKTEARNIANVIETRVVEKAKDSRVALATLYVLDSIAKNCRDPYASVFAPHVAGVFLTLFAQTDEKTKQSMKKLLGTWETQNVFPREVLARIQTDVDLSSNARVPPPPPPIVHQNRQRVAPPPPMMMMMGQPQQQQQQQQQFLGQPPPLVAGGMPVVLPDLSGLLNTMKAQQAQSMGGSHQSLQGLAATAPLQGGGLQHHRPATPDFANEDFDFLDADESLKKFKKDLKSLNKRREYLINALYDDLQFKCAQTGRRFASKQSLDQHMDWLHAKRRRKKSGRACRGWHVSAKEWIEGTIQMGETEPEFDAFAGRGKKKETAVGITIDENLDLNDLPSVPAIESQKKCALSGEPFETFWNEKAQEWHYGKAIKLKRAIGSKKVKAGEIALISAIPKEELEPELIEAIAKAQPRNASTKGAVLRESKRAKK